MSISFPLLVRRLGRLLLPGALGLLATGCQKDEVKDYGPIDDGLIRQYLADHQIANAQRQSSGLYYVPVTTDTSAVRARPGKTVSVLYTGALLDGTVFDASVRHSNPPMPIKFVLGRRQVIDGWDEGIALMRKGEKSQLLIPSALGYGPTGSYPSIPANAVLRFEVELVDVK